MDVTASLNIDKKTSWNGIQVHLRHDPNVNHANAYLNTKESKRLRQFNQHLTHVDFNEFTHEKFMPYIQEHDALAKKRGHFQFKNVRTFMYRNGSGEMLSKRFDYPMVAKFASMQDFNDFKDKASKAISQQKGISVDDAKDDINRTISDALADYANGFNERNKEIKLFESYIHMDEKGAPHLHAHIMPYIDTGANAYGHMKKPSMSLNRALTDEFGHTGKNANKVNLADFSQQESIALLNAVNNQVYQKYPYLGKKYFKLVRLTKSNDKLMTGQNHDLYVKTQQELDKQKALLDQQKKENADLKKQLAEQNKTYTDNHEKLHAQVLQYNKTQSELDELKQENDNLKKQNSEYVQKQRNQKQTIYDYNQVIIKRNETIKQQNKELDILQKQIKKVSSSGATSTDLDKREKALNDRENQLREKEKKAKTLLDDIENQAKKLAHVVSFWKKKPSVVVRAVGYALNQSDNKILRSIGAKILDSNNLKQVETAYTKFLNTQIEGAKTIKRQTNQDYVDIQNLQGAKEKKPDQNQKEI